MTYNFKITPVEDRGLKTVLYRNRLLCSMVEVGDWIDVRFDVGEQAHPAPSNIQFYAYATPEEFFNDWNIFDRRVLIEKTGFCI